MAVGLDELVARVRSEVGDETWEDRTTVYMGANDSTVYVSQPIRWAEGDILEFGDESGEEVRVLADGVSGSSLSVKRGHDNSPKVVHQAQTFVVKNPVFGYNETVLSINRTIHRMWPWAWGKRRTTITPSPSTVKFYALPEDFIDLISVTQKNLSTPADYLFYGAKGSGRKIKVVDGVQIEDFGGKAITFPGDFDNNTNAVYINYRAILEIGDIEEGLMADTVVMGTTERMLARRQSQRSGQDVRQAEPGTPTIYLQDVSYYRQSFDENLRRLYDQLLVQAPPMRTWG